MQKGHGFESGGYVESWDSPNETFRRNYAWKQMSGGAIVPDFL